MARVTHRDSVETLVGMGRDIERTVLARAVRAHLEDRVLVDGDAHGRLLGAAGRMTATGERGSRPLASATA